MTPTRVTPHLSAHAMVTQQIHIQVKCLHECHMSCIKCHHAHNLSHSPTPSHMHMPSVKTVTGITNDPCIEPSPAPLPNASVNGQPILSQSRLLSHNPSLCDNHDCVSSLGNRTFRITVRVSYTHVLGFSPEGVNNPLLAPPNTHYLYLFILFYFFDCETIIGRCPKYELTTHSSTMMMGDHTHAHTPCETPRKSNFLKKGKMDISVKIQNFSRSWMTKRTSPLESSRAI